MPGTTAGKGTGDLDCPWRMVMISLLTRFREPTLESVFQRRRRMDWSPGFSRLKPGLQPQDALSRTDTERHAMTGRRLAVAVVIGILNALCLGAALADHATPVLGATPRLLIASRIDADGNL